MAKSAYIGVDGKARKIKKMYIGVDGVARRIKKGYIGDENGIARLFWTAGMEMVSGTFTAPTEIGISVSVNLGFKPKYLLIYGGVDKSDQTGAYISTIIIYNNGSGQAATMFSNLNVENDISLGKMLSFTTSGFKVTWDSSYSHVSLPYLHGYPRLNYIAFKE
jgi:hypothetical protein